MVVWCLYEQTHVRTTRGLLAGIDGTSDVTVKDGEAATTQQAMDKLINDAIVGLPEGGEGFKGGELLESGFNIGEVITSGEAGFIVDVL